MAPRRSSAAWVVVAVKPESGVVLLPLPVLVLSNVPDLARPENSSAVRAPLVVVERHVNAWKFPARTAGTIGVGESAEARISHHTPTPFSAAVLAPAALALA